MKDLEDLKYILGIEMLRSSKGVILNQRKYVLELIADSGLTGAKPTPTPLESSLRLISVKHDLTIGYIRDSVLHDVAPYQGLIVKLLYATIIRPVISYVVQTLSQSMQSPKKSHWEDAIRVVRHGKGTIGQGVWLHAKSTTMLTSWCDSD